VELFPCFFGRLNYKFVCLGFNLQACCCCGGCGCCAACVCVCEWESERVREWESERVREWDSETVRQWERESERVREWECWISLVPFQVALLVQNWSYALSMLKSLVGMFSIERARATTLRQHLKFDIKTFNKHQKTFRQHLGNINKTSKNI
jgi:hypothetical protein